MLNLETLFTPTTCAKIEDSINRRHRSPALTVTIDSFRALREPVKRLLEINQEVEKIKEERASELEILKNEISSPQRDIEVSKLRVLGQSLAGLREKLYDLEEQVIPTILSLPCPLNPDVPSLEDDEHVVKSVNLSKLNEKPSFKQLDFRQLSYINESMYASLVGPDSMYNKGKIAQLHFSIQDYFGDLLRQHDYTDFVGMDFVKDAVIEATHSRHDKDYLSDPFRISGGYSSSEETQHMHIAGDSTLESFSAFVCKKKWRLDNESLERLFSLGTNYYLNGDSRITQRATVNSFVLLAENSTVSSSEKEVDRLLSILWSAYSALGIPVKVIKTPAPLLRLNESFRYDINVYVKSMANWVTVGYIANNLDHISSRLGIESAHTVNSMVVDVKPVIMSIVEYSQQSDGKLSLPKLLDLFT